MRNEIRERRTTMDMGVINHNHVARGIETISDTAINPPL